MSNVVTKAAFGKLMETFFTELTAGTIVNGFRASGIFPWNAENIDFSKCLGAESVCSNPVVLNDNAIIVDQISPTDFHM